MCGFIAQLVEQRTSNAEVMGLNPVEPLIFFFRRLLSNCLNWKIYCDDHSPLSSTTAVQKIMNYFIYFTLSYYHYGIIIIIIYIILYYYYLWPSAGTFLVCECRHVTKENNFAQFRRYFKEP